MVLTLRNLESPDKALNVLNILNAKDSRKYKSWKFSLLKYMKSKKTKVGSRKKNQLNFVDATLLTVTYHKQLSLFEDKLKRAQTYLKLGELYDQFPSLGFWELPEQYFEACIHTKPSSKVAQQCYFSYENRFMKFSEIPKFKRIVQVDDKKLKKLKELAFRNKEDSIRMRDGFDGDYW